MGARHLPYERSRDLIPKAIQQIDAFIEARKVELERAKSGKFPVPSFHGIMHPNEPMYVVRQREYVSKIEWEIKSANRDKERLQKRYETWKQDDSEVE